MRFLSFIWSTNTSRILDQTSVSLEQLLRWFQYLRNQDGCCSLSEGRYKLCQISSAAITMIGPKSRDWPPHGVMLDDVDTERRKCTWNSCVLLWDRENNYLYHLAYSLFDNSLTYSEVTDCSVELLHTATKRTFDGFQQREERCVSDTEKTLH